MALRQHHPPPGMKPRISDAMAARGRRSGTPVRADGAEPDVVEQVSSQYPPAHMPGARSAGRDAQGDSSSKLPGALAFGRFQFAAGDMVVSIANRS